MIHSITYCAKKWELGVVLTAVLYTVFELFQTAQLLYMRWTLNTDVFNRAPLDKKLWLSGPIALLTTMFCLITRVAGIAFLIYLGFQTRWYYPIILFVVSLLIVAILLVVIHKLFGIRFPAILGFLVIPIVGVWMWFSVE